MRYSAVTFLLALLFTSRLPAQCPPSPLVVNLEGPERVRTTSVLSPVLFDIFDRGVRDEVAWTDPAHDEAFLWLDLNHNGYVDSGRELFGNFTLLSSGQRASNGFEALAQYDTRSLGGNGDGEIDEHDFIWDYLRLWIDRDHDGVAERREQYSLPSLGVRSISLHYVKNALDARLDGHGNVHAYVSTVTLQGHARHGSRERETVWVEDVYLRVKPQS